jgi:hypothetical protein
MQNHKESLWRTLDSCYVHIYFHSSFLFMKATCTYKDMAHPSASNTHRTRLFSVMEIQMELQGVKKNIH